MSTSEEILVEAEINPSKIYFLRFLLEAHGHLALLRTRNGGNILLYTSKGNLPLLKSLLEEIRLEIGLKRIKVQRPVPQSLP